MNLSRAPGPARQAMAYLHATRHHSRPTAPSIRPLPHVRFRLRGNASGLFGLPLQARVADLLADAMLAMGEAIAMCEAERYVPLEAACLPAQIRSASDHVNLLMKTISD
jgi:hypothetical protein